MDMCVVVQSLRGILAELLDGYDVVLFDGLSYGDGFEPMKLCIYAGSSCLLEVLFEDDGRTVAMYVYGGKEVMDGLSSWTDGFDGLLNRILELVNILSQEYILVNISI